MTVLEMLVEMGAGVRPSPFDGSWGATLSGDRGVYSFGHDTPAEAVIDLHGKWLQAGRPAFEIYSQSEAEEIKTDAENWQRWRELGQATEEGS